VLFSFFFVLIVFVFKRRISHRDLWWKRYKNTKMQNTKYMYKGAVDQFRN
jgi:hypothetical protein